MNYYLKALKKEILNVIYITILLIFQAAGIVLLPFFVAEIVDEGIAKANYDIVYKYIVFMIITLVITTLVMVVLAKLSAKVSTRIGQRIRNQFIIKSQQLSSSQINSIGTNSLVTRTSNDISVIQGTTNSVIQMVLPTPFIIVASIFLVYYISPKLVFIPLIALVLFIILTIILLVIASPIGNKIQDDVDDIILNVRETITGVRVIRAFDQTNAIEEKNEKAFIIYKNRLI